MADEFNHDALMADLEEFSSQRRQKQSRCATCRLPNAVREAVRKGREESEPPVAYKALAQWLAEKGFKNLNTDAIRNHFVDGHEKGKSNGG